MREGLRTGLRLLAVGIGLALIAAGLRELVLFKGGQAEVAKSWKELPIESKPEIPEKRRVPNEGAPVARLAIPRLQMDWYVVSGTGAKELRRGPGHLRGTAWPGERGNSVIAGHRDTHFRALKDIRTGDQITIQTAQRQFAYSVIRTLIVQPEDISVLQPANRPILTLVTCYPFYYLGPAPKRFVIQAELAVPGSSAER